MKQKWTNKFGSSQSVIELRKPGKIDQEERRKKIPI